MNKIIPLQWYVLCAFQASLVISVASSKSCFSDQKTSDIPADHKSWCKQKPWVFGHKGNPKEYQENTIEGFQSLVGLKADGLETDTFLTNDGQLVLFHDDNAKKLTGIDKKIWEMTKEEIKELKYKKTITYGEKKFHYNSSLKVALLEDLLTDMKKNNLLLYIEMKPMSIVHKDSAYTIRSFETGKAVAQLIRKHGFENRVFLASFDPVKTWAAKQENPNLVIGSFFLDSYWTQKKEWYEKLRNQLEPLPGLSKCFSNSSLQKSENFMNFLFENGSISKSIDASFLDIHFEMFKKSRVDIHKIRDNYNKKISLGTSTIYDMKLNENQTQETEPMIQNVIDAKLERLFTDNVTRLRQKLETYGVSGFKPPIITACNFAKTTRSTITITMTLFMLLLVIFST